MGSLIINNFLSYFNNLTGDSRPPHGAWIETCELSDKIGQLKLQSSDWKRYETGCDST